MPDIGSGLCESGPLLGFEDVLRDLQAAPENAFVLPAVTIARAGQAERSETVSIRIVWSAKDSLFRILTLAEAETIAAMRSAMGASRVERLEREQYEAALARVRGLESLYRDIVDKSEDVIFRLDETSKIMFANAAALRVLSLDPVALPSLRLEDVLSAPEGGSSWRELLEQSRDRPNEAAVAESEMTDCGGVVRWYSWTLGWLGFEGMRQFQLIGRDVSDSRKLLLEERRASENALIAVAEKERVRIARDLHDTLVRSILSVLAQIRLVAKMLPRAGKEEVADELALAEEVARSGVTLAREAIFEMRLELSPEHPLGEMLERAAQASAKRAGMTARVEIAPVIQGAADACAEAVYRFCSEALRNVELHAGASRVVVRVWLDTRAGLSRINAAIEDNGVGFDPAIRRPGHYGLVGMAEQARQFGGDAEFVSVPGKGTVVRLSIPLPDARAV